MNIITGCDFLNYSFCIISGFSRLTEENERISLLFKDGIDCFLSKSYEFS